MLPLDNMIELDLCIRLILFSIYIHFILVYFIKFCALIKFKFGERASLTMSTSINKMFIGENILIY